METIAAKEQKVFKYETLVAATRNFNPKQRLGEGGFGPVFKVRRCVMMMRSIYDF